MPASTLVDVLSPVRSDPARSAILLDVDGTLAPIVRHAADASVPEPTRALLIALAGRYAIMACITGRRATDARRMVSIGSIAYVGNHGGETLRPGATRPEVDQGLEREARRVRTFATEADSADLMRLKVRLEDKDTIVAFHWRGAPDESAARAALAEVARDAQAAGLVTHWGRKVLEVRPPVALDKGVGIRRLLSGTGVTAAVYVGDDTTDLDAFRALGELVESGELAAGVRVGVRSDEGPPEIVEQADAVVDGPAGVRELLRTLLAE